MVHGGSLGVKMDRSTSVQGHRDIRGEIKKKEPGCSSSFPISGAALVISVSALFLRFQNRIFIEKFKTKKEKEFLKKDSRMR